jgi:hypothetical protein
MPLDVMSRRDMPEEAGKHLADAVELFLKTASDHGILDKS